jgi:hypothetical protein
MISVAFLASVLLATPPAPPAPGVQITPVAGVPIEHVVSAVEQLHKCGPPDKKKVSGCVVVFLQHLGWVVVSECVQVGG